MKYPQCYDLIEVSRFVFGLGNDLLCGTLLEARPPAPDYSFGYSGVFALTLMLEAPFYFVLTKAATQLLMLLILANLCTHPFVVFFFPQFFEDTGFYLMASELFAPLAESVILRLALPDVSMLRTMSIVFIANMVSWNAGIYLVYFWQGL